MITYDKIKLEGDIKIQLKEFAMTVRGNQHARARLKGILSKDIIKSRYDTKNSKIKVFYYDENKGSFQILFSGIVDKIVHENRGGILFAEVELISGTVLLDRDQRSRTFQNVKNTYKNVVSKVIEHTRGADYTATVGEREIKKPLIQYQETDWAFIRRLASHFHAQIYADSKIELPRFWFGFPNLTQKIVINKVDYIAGIDEEYLEAQTGSSFYVYYEIELTNDYDIGTLVILNGKYLSIEQKQVEFNQGCLIFRYKLRIPQSIFVKKIYNEAFTGMSLLGNVLSTSGERLKLHLDLDESQKKEEAYSYQWTPDTGSVMYCMPQINSRVSLYFPSSDEQRARVTGCIRENGGSCAAMSDPNQRGLTTEYKKALLLNPEDMGVKGENSSLSLVDDQFISFESNKKIIVSSEKQIKFTAKKVSLVTPKEINMLRG